MINHKGTDCPYSKDKPLLCQEGYCSDCQIYQTATISVSRLTKRIQIRRDDAFTSEIGVSRERRLQLRSMVNAYDLVLKDIRALGGKE